MKYYNQKVSNGLTYSLDMIRLSCSASYKELERFLSDYNESNQAKQLKLDKPSYVLMKYKNFITIEYFGFGVLKMGFHMNGICRERLERGFVEFNPNKLGNSEDFWEDFKLIKSHIDILGITRFDLAIDIPKYRNKIAFVKDNRMYSCIQKSNLNFTEYLGKKNKPGRVKLYNKQIEMDLEYPLTRLEITCSENKVNLPKVVDLSLLKGADLELMQIILLSGDLTQAIAKLTPYKRGKVNQILENYLIQFDSDCINTITRYAKDLVYE